ncbi:MAG TPA: M35 family metallo-endopeptidase, partial [Pyrinomonadaceae bacterium]|nr:M35 family metallo-endopeptidase [Pyrinomonadaceae bacterium]
QKLTMKKKEAHDVLEILKALSDEDLKDTVAEMEKEKLVDTFFASLSEADINANQDGLRRIKNFRVYTTTTKTGDTTVTTTVTGSCSPTQFAEIAAATISGLAWLDKTVAALDAYIAKPNDASTKEARSALNDYFKTTAANVATYVRGQLDHIRKDLRSLPSFTVECHGSWDRVCGAAGAYIPGDDRERVVFCNGFFKGENKATDWQRDAIIHEMAHTQVGGTHIGDRAYDTDRMLKHLTTEEALTNAESYARIAHQLGSGKKGPEGPPADTYEDCSKDGKNWKSTLDLTLARAQRWNRDALIRVAKLTPDKAKEYSALDIQHMGGTTQSDIDALRAALKKLADELKSGIDFECEPKGGGRCDRKRVRTYWYAAGDLHICPALLTDSPDEQVIQLLAGLYGYKADVDDNTKRFNYARFAQSSATAAAPSLGTILGSSAWSADDLRIFVLPTKPAMVAGLSYYESGRGNLKVSNNMPVYHGPLCQKSNLPFECKVLFAVDSSANPRPAPFTPPRLSVEFEYPTVSSPIKESHTDPRADYVAAEAALATKLPREFKFTFLHDGPFNMKFELQDPDTGITRVYQDTINLMTQGPCSPGPIPGVPSPVPSNVAPSKPAPKTPEKK